jgi:transposase, IS5 family
VRQAGFFDVEERLEAISAKGDPLETVKTAVPWEDFRIDIEAVTETKLEDRKSNAGRKPYDAILKFKILVLQSLYNLSDEQTEFLIRDRLSFMRFDVWRGDYRRATVGPRWLVPEPRSRGSGSV